MSEAERIEVLEAGKIKVDGIEYLSKDIADKQAEDATKHIGSVVRIADKAMAWWKHDMPVYTEQTAIYEDTHKKLDAVKADLGVKT